MNKELYEENVMMLIVAAGTCRSLLMQAMKAAREADFDLAEKLLTEAKENLSQAHHIQTQLIEYDEGEGRLAVHIVMVHAQDHVMNAVLLTDLTHELIEIHKRLNNK